MGAFFRQLAVGDCNYGVCGDCNAIGVIHTGFKSGGEKVTLFGSDCDGGASAGIGVIHTGPKSGAEKVTLFGIDCDSGVSAGIGVIHTGPKTDGDIFGIDCDSGYTRRAEIFVLNVNGLLS